MPKIPPTTLWTYGLVACGGALGTVLRFWLAGFVADRSNGALPWGQSFPWGTLLINISGSLAIGFFSTLTEPGVGRWLVSTPGRQFFMIGICGGFTTFSSFSRDTLNLARNGDWLKVGTNVIGSVALCLFAVWLGHVLAQAINSTRGN